MSIQHPSEAYAPTMRTQTALAAIGALHRYAAEQLLTTLADTQHTEERVANAMDLTPTQTALLEQRKRELLEYLLTLVQWGDINIIDTLQSYRQVAQVEMQIYRQIDVLVQAYRQHIQMILRR